MSTVLHHEVHGQPGKLELVLLHGWGLHSGVWKPLLPLLTPHFRVTCVDLPGFGRSPATISYAAFFDAVLPLVPARALWVGWSLGGLLALEMAARHPERVQALSLIAATPCFLQRDDWRPAMALTVFEDFVASLQESPLLTLESFLSLQCKGSASMRSDIRFLHEVVEQGPNLATATLLNGLQLLERGDLRTKFAALRQPVQFLLGEKDVLVPASLQVSLKVLRAGTDIVVIPQAAHVPFLSHPQRCADELLRFAGALK
ncbi:MAG TPA: pimeloyl-ACP methyl ester esterase BioH [Moraxellaceae bacterium]